jgi:RNA polymerase sigma factor for flagellar operon FliA
MTTDDRDALIEQHRPYVRALALEIIRSLPPNVELDELIACGYLGLVEAAERYDPRYGASFQTFAYYRIRGAIYDGLRKMGPLSRTEYSRQRFAANANDIVQSVVDDEYGRANVSLNVDDEIASVKGLIDDLLPVFLLSLDDDNPPLVVDETPNAEAMLEKNDLIAYTRGLISQLQDDDRFVIEQVYFKNRPLVEIAQELKVSKSWGSRLHARAIRNLRRLMEEHGLLEPDA